MKQQVRHVAAAAVALAACSPSGARAAITRLRASAGLPHLAAEPGSPGANASVALGGRSGDAAPSKPTAVCVDNPSSWRSNTSNKCEDYFRFQWCDQDGGYGEGWGNNGEFADWVRPGMPLATSACCACGGGTDVSLSVSALGADGCGEGASVVTDLATCEAASKAMGVGFTASAAWPEGHPRGCHTDSRRSAMWLNGSPAGAAHDEFAVLCAAPSAGGSGSGSGDSGSDDAGAAEEAIEPAALAERSHLRAKVAQTHSLLARSLKRRVDIGVELRGLDDQAASSAEIRSSVAAVEKETASKSMAGLLGDMWTEMRMFATPFYEERLEEEALSLEKEASKLEADHDEAQANLDKFEKKHAT